MRHVFIMCVLGVVWGVAPIASAQDAMPISLTQTDGRSTGRFIQASPHHGDNVMSVTTESPEYCEQLATNVDAIIAEPHGVEVGDMDDARRLRAHGIKLCQSGHLRAGIERLRRALVLLEHSQGHS